jgi:hypothetical protein
MDSENIENFISCFGGRVFSLDHLPLKRVEVPFYSIINTDVSSAPGLHWISIAIIVKNGKRVIYYHDSLGIVPCLREVIAFINLNYDGSLICNKHQLQSASSSTCGNYCVLFLQHVQGGGAYEDFLKEFGDSPSQNDRKIKSFFDGLMLEDIKPGGQACKSLLRHASFPREI